MKYIVFSSVLLSVPAAAFLLAMTRRHMRCAMFLLPLPVLCFSATAINFFSHEFYRGTSRGMEVSIIYLAALTVLLALAMLRGGCALLPTAGSKLYLLYLTLCLPSLMSAESCLFAFFEVWKMLMLHLVFLAVFHYLEYSRGDSRILINAFAFITAGVFLCAVRQHFGGVYQIRAQFPHQNSLSMFMMPLTAIFLSGFLNCRKMRRRALFFAAFAMAAGTLLRTYSRGAIACLPLTCLVTAAVSLVYEWQFRKLQLLSVFAIAGLLITLAFLPRVLERFESAPKSSGETRLNFAIAAVNMIRDEPLFGVGLNNWGIKINPPYEYSTHRDPSRGYSDDFKDGIVETIYLLVAAECGLPCFFALLLFFGYYWLTAFRLLRRLRRTPYFYLAAGILGGLTGIYLQSVLEWVLKQQLNFMELLILFAILDYLNSHWQRLRQQSRETPQLLEARA